MQKFFFILALLFATGAHAQSKEQKLSAVMKEFHQALVQKNMILIDQQTHSALTYGHSNGWIETKADMISDLKTGIISYQSFREDSVQVLVDDNIAHIRFAADIDATLRGNASHFHLKVLEVWVKKDKSWILFARQAIR